MFVIRFWKIQLCLMLATAFFVSMWSAASQAYSPEQQQACSDDAFRICSAEIPDIDRVTACMVRNKEQLSPGCRAFFKDPAPAVAPVRAGKPLAIKPAPARKPASAKPRKPKDPE